MFRIGLSVVSLRVSYIHCVLVSLMLFMWGSSVRIVALSVWAVAAIMLSAIGILYLCLISAEFLAISGVTFTVLKSFSRRLVLVFAVSRPSFCSVSV